FQYVEGETLEKLLGRRGMLPIKRCVAFAQDIASALEHAHGWNIVHRDVKPANILIENSSGVAKLADFGIVKAPWAAKTQEGDTLGSPGYMSPEQIDGSELDERADLFCLGVVLYQMLSGRHPFLRDTVAGTAYATCNGAYTPLREIVSSVPPALDWAIRKCLAVDRKKRIGSAKELLSLLKTVAPSSGGSGQTPAENKPAQKLKGATKRDFVHYLVKPFTVRHEPADDRLLWFKIKHWFHRVEKPVVGLWKSMRAMVRWADRSRRAFFLFWVSMAVIIIIICAIGIGFIINPPALPPENSVEGKLFRQCSEALEKSNREAALEAGNKLTSMNPIHPQSWIVLARIMIREGKYDVAANELKRVPSLKGGKKTLKKALPAILLEICRQMKKGPAPPPLLDMAVHTLSAGANPLVRSWIQDTNHWLRWNAVEVLKMSNSDIDIVPVYIQDLSFAGSVQVRLAAVDSLGEIGDKRAIPALKKVMALDQNDPLASAEAGKVLEEKFK
ncbi:MAG: protein kinase, partial [Chitinivibrionales bacterium]